MTAPDPRQPDDGPAKPAPATPAQVADALVAYGAAAADAAQAFVEAFRRIADMARESAAIRPESAQESEVVGQDPGGAQDRSGDHICGMPDLFDVSTLDRPRELRCNTCGTHVIQTDAPIDATPTGVPDHGDTTPTTRETGHATT